jgi:hypothetical protein
MNLILRIALTFLLVESLFGDAWTYLVAILAFSVLVDLDLLPWLLRRDTNPVRTRPGPEARSRFHELYGLVLFSVGVSLASIFGDEVLLQVVALALLVHYAADALLTRIRPFYPYSDTDVYMWDDVANLHTGPQFEHRNKAAVVRALRERADRLLLRLPLPRMNPSYLSGASLVATLLFLAVLRHSSVAALVLLVIIVLLDWLDGITAQKHELCSEQGYMIDLAADRISEGLLFIPFFVPWFYLFVLNTLLTVVSFVRQKHTILSLRQAFLIYFVVVTFA